MHMDEEPLSFDPIHSLPGELGSVPRRVSQSKLIPLIPCFLFSSDDDNFTQREEQNSQDSNPVLESRESWNTEDDREGKTSTPGSNAKDFGTEKSTNEVSLSFIQAQLYSCPKPNLT